MFQAEMQQALSLYAKQMVSVGGFRVTKLSRNVYRLLLTALQSLLSQPIVMILSLIKRAKRLPGRLIVDDTSNPKYGLKRFCRKLKLLTTGGFAQGFKIVLFLWESQGIRLPLGFALWHNGTKSLNELFLAGISHLRNQARLKPEVVLFDAAYMTDRSAKRLEDYGWAFVSRFKKNRKLSGTSICRLIPRGYGQIQGFLGNGAKIKVLRRKGFFLASNRMLWDTEKLLQTYRLRWAVEESFRLLKSGLRLNGCQQHSMRAQALYLFVCLLLFTCLQGDLDTSPYKTLHSVISGDTQAETCLIERLLQLC